LADIGKSSVGAALTPSTSHEGTGTSVHPSWLRLMRYCSELGHGEIEKLKIQDGLPMLAEVTTRKIKFSP
jgi:hypothetical protein